MTQFPQPFGRFELLDRISAGGMAEVFRARDPVRNGQIVAIKKILPHIAADDEFIQMFEDEGRIASRLEHPHIARTLDFGRTPAGEYFISFEYVKGRDLRAVFDRAVNRREAVPLPFAIHVFARIGEGLAYAHARRDDAGKPAGIVHRDVSPQNIVVSFAGDVKLIDFGIAKAAGKASRTRVGAIKGKFGYMSPEQVRGLEVDQQTDVFSLGICMWELLTGERLFAAANELLVLEKIRNLQIPEPSTRNPGVPAHLDRIVLKALAKDPGERYRDARELFRDLNALAQHADAAATRQDIAEYMNRLFTEDASKEIATSGYGKVGDHGTTRGAEMWSEPQAPSPRQVQETRTMAENKGSDLDIFEGLGKKSDASMPAPRGPGAPPPPSRGPGAPPPPPGDFGKRTLLGVPAPIAPPPNRPPSNQPPPPPPGRGQLPAIVAPPPRSIAPAEAAPAAPAPERASDPLPPPPAAEATPAPVAPAAGGMQMDWDDEEEATHVFDKDSEGAFPMPAKRPPAAGAPAVLAPPPAAAAPPPPSAFARTMAMGNIPAPPMTAPGGFGPPRAPSSPFAPPPPPSPLSSTAQGLGLPIGNAPMQTATEPLKMPPRPPSMSPVAGGFAPQPLPPPPGLPQGMGAPPSAYGQPPQSYAPTMPAPGTLPPAQQFAPNRLEATALVTPPQQSSAKLGIILGAILGGVVLIGAVGAFALIPRTGRILVQVTDAKGSPITGEVKVFVDGAKVCDTAPCTVDQVRGGTHDVKVTSDKYDTLSKMVVVEARKDAPLEMALSGGAKSSGFKVAGSQRGVKLLVDGNEIGALPQELRELTPGEHKLKFVGAGDRYATVEKSVNVSNGEVTDLGDVNLKVVKGKATITLATAGAKVSMVSSTGDRRDIPNFPLSIDIEPAKSSWTIEASKPGFDDLKLPISFDDGQAEKEFNITLAPKGAAPATTAAPPQTTAAATTATAAPATAKPTTTAAPATTKSGGGEAKFALITALPPSGSVCLVDNKPIGAVPKTDIATTPGAHTIRCINKGEGLSKSVDVVVGAGESKKVIVRLRD